MVRLEQGQFLEACGMAGPLRLEFAHAGRVWSPAPGLKVLPQPFALIGRDPGADLVLDHPEISRRHAYLQVIRGGVFALDLETRTGLRWGGVNGSSGWLAHGQGLGIGPFWIRPQEPPRGAEAEGLASGALPTERASDRPDLAPISLEFLDKSGQKLSWRSRRAMVLLGRSPTCKLRLPGAEVSRIHAALVNTPSGLWAVDLLSREGILVNGTKVRSARLEGGDELRIGLNRIRVRAEAEPSRGPRALALPMGGRTGVTSSPAAPEVRPILAAELEPTDSLAMALLGDFRQAQQQMAEQFQQSLIMMFQMFSGMHQDQMGLIREELAQIRRLAEEQDGLQAELARRSVDQAERPALRLVSAGPTAEGRAPATGPAAEGRAPDAEPPRTAMPRPRPDPGADRDPGDLHAALAQRLATIQEERQGRWQKLLGAVMGREPGSSS